MTTVKSRAYLMAEDSARQTEAKITAMNFTWSRRVKVDHEDGTILDFAYAFTMPCSDGWFSVHTEHHGFFVFHETEATIIEYTKDTETRICTNE